MPSTRALWAGTSVVAFFALAISTGFASEQRSKAELPAAVARTVMDNCPNAEIAAVEVEKSGGVTLYDIEFKGGRDDIKVAEDGSVIDIATIIKVKELPPAALSAIQNAAPGATIKQVEKSEVRAEVIHGRVVKLARPRLSYGAEMVKGNQHAEVQVSLDGKVIEAPKWKN